MRILYLTNGFPFPLTSGYLRHYFLIRELSQRHSITLLSFVNSDFCESHVAALRPYTAQVLTFRHPFSGGGMLSKTIRGARMLLGTEAATRRMRTVVGELTRTKPFDVAFVSGKHTLPALRELRGVPVVADICDAASVRMRGRIRLAGPLQIPSMAARYLLMRQIEKNILRRASHSIFASGRDRDALTHPTDPCATIVPNGVDLEYWKRSSASRDVNTIVFTGAMHYPPNADAAAHLVRDIFPRVRTAIPAAKLFIVGRDPAPLLLREATRQTSVTVTGFVDDVRPFLDRATVFAAPLRFAAGIQNKVLEAMAMDIPVIASPLAAAGVRTENGLQAPLEVADGGQAFAQAILRQLHAGNQCPAAHSTAREYVRQHFCWRQGAEKLERILCRVAGCSHPHYAPNAGLLEALLADGVHVESVGNS